MKINYLFSARFIKNTLATITTIAFVFGGIFVPISANATTATLPVALGVTQITAVQHTRLPVGVMQKDGSGSLM